ncbi:MAG: hypothetical protein QXZ17_00990 [Nitrososphaerota archaeon]
MNAVHADLPTISVVIVNWNGDLVLLRCVRSVLESDYHNFEVIVVDNLRLLFSKRRSLGLEKPYVYMQFLVFRHNLHEIREAINFARKIKVDAIMIASARVYTGTDVIKPTKDGYEVSKEYLPEPGSRFSHYTSDLKRVGSKKVCDWL